MIDFLGRLSGQDRRERVRHIDDLLEWAGLLPFPIDRWAVAQIFREVEAHDRILACLIRYNRSNNPHT